jgi:hypothetical protein
MDLQTGIFCRISDKTTWPVCHDPKTNENCFNRVLNQLVINGIAARDEPYKHIIDWTSAAN